MATSQEEHAGGGRDYAEPAPQPFLGSSELRRWSLYRAAIAEFVATLLFLYVTVATVIGHKRRQDADADGEECGGVGLLGVAWAFGGMIFILVYCTAGVSGGHVNPAVTFGLLVARKVTLLRAAVYVAAQCLGAVCGAGLVRALNSAHYARLGGGANVVGAGYSKGAGLAAEVAGTFVLVYTVFSATDAKRSARDSHIPVLAPLPSVSPCSWCTSPPSRSPARASTRRGASAPPSSTISQRMARSVDLLGRASRRGRHCDALPRACAEGECTEGTGLIQGSQTMSSWIKW